ncbi:hypothetical protein FRB99_003448 [Tulasnella sp. 403]|nr:hypothetical protein FRB99_003448 [Tulasnella sp. 403]
MSSWWSRKAASKAPGGTTTIATNVLPAPSSRSPSSIVSASNGRYGQISPSYSNVPRSANPPSHSNGYLDPYHQPPIQGRKESAPARLVHSTYSYDSRLDPTLAINPPKRETPSRPSTSAGAGASAQSALIGNIFGLGGNKSKRPSTTQTRSTPASIEETIDIRPEPIPPRINTAVRNRAYTLSGSTATTVSAIPITPIDNEDSPVQIIGRRGRSDSASSQPGTLARRTKQPPSLLAVEECDPFGAHSTDSFYVLPTPPVLAVEEKMFEQPDPRMIRQRVASEGYYEGALDARAASTKTDIIGTLKLPRRPSAPAPGGTRTAPPSNGKPGPAGAGPFGKKHLPLLPFRSKPPKEAKRVEEPARTESPGLLGSLLRPQHEKDSHRLSGNSSITTNSARSRSGSISDQPRFASAATSRDHSPSLPPICLSPADFTYDPITLDSKPPSLTSSWTIVSPDREVPDHSVVDLLPPGERTSATQPPALTSSVLVSLQPAPGSRHRPLSSESKTSSESRQRRLRAALAVSVQDLDDRPPVRKNELEVDLNLNFEVDVTMHDTLRPDSSISGRIGLLDVDDKRARVSPVRGEEGTFELLLPPKTEARLNGGIRDSHQYGAPSFIEEPATSPGDGFFASPYPSGVTTVPVFRESDEWKRESSVQDALAVISGEAAKNKSAGASPVLGGSPRSTPLRSQVRVPEASPGENQNMGRADESSARSSPSYTPLIFPSSVDAPSPSRKSKASPPDGYPPPHSPPPSATTIQPSRSNATLGAGISPLNIRKKDSTTPSPIVTSSASPPHSPVSPVHFGTNPIFKNTDATVSTLSFSSMSSHGGRRRSSARRKTDDDTSDVDDDMRQSSRSANRRGSESASSRPKIEDVPLATSFGGQGILASVVASQASSFVSGIPPPSRSRKLSKDKSRDAPPSPPTPRQARSPPRPSSRSRHPIYNFVSNLASSSASTSLDEYHGSLPDDQASVPPSQDGHASPVTDLKSIIAQSPPKRPTIRASKSTSPSRSDFTPMHIVPPSELIRIGDAAADEDFVLSPHLGQLTEKDDLLHGDFDDMGSALHDPEGATWVSELGALPASTHFNPRTLSMMAIYEGRETSRIPALPRLPRPSTSSRRDSGMSKSSSILNQGRRPSTSQSSMASFPTTVGPRNPGAPLSPPPLRSRLPRSSISSSMRSLPTAILPPGTAPLAPPPPTSRARAMSNSEAPPHPPPTRSIPIPPRRVSEVTLPVLPSKLPPPPAREKEIPVVAFLPEKKPPSKNSTLVFNATTALKKKRQSLKPSFFDFEDEGNEDDEDDVKAPVAKTREAQLVESSFLDLGRGNSMDSMRE